MLAAVYGTFIKNMPAIIASVLLGLIARVWDGWRSSEISKATPTRFRKALLSDE
jgi:hypothetical protein